jgi:hypothetical protein
LLGKALDGAVLLLSNLSGPFVIALLPVAALEYLARVDPGKDRKSWKAWLESSRRQLWSSLLVVLFLVYAIWQGIEFLGRNVTKDQILGANLHLL